MRIWSSSGRQPKVFERSINTVSNAWLLSTACLDFPYITNRQCCALWPFWAIKLLLRKNSSISNLTWVRSCIFCKYFSNGSDMTLSLFWVSVTLVPKAGAALAFLLEIFPSIIQKMKKLHMSPKKSYKGAYKKECQKGAHSHISPSFQCP